MKEGTEVKEGRKEGYGSSRIGKKEVRKEPMTEDKKEGRKEEREVKEGRKEGRLRKFNTTND